MANSQKTAQEFIKICVKKTQTKPKQKSNKIINQ